MRKNRLPSECAECANLKSWTFGSGTNWQFHCKAVKEFAKNKEDNCTYRKEKQNV